MAGIANSLTRAIKTRKIRTGRELGQTVRLILAILDQDPELRASQLAKRDKRALYSGAGMIVARAVAQVERDREAEQATQELVARIRREREEAKRSWAAFNRPELEAEARKRQLSGLRQFQGELSVQALVPEREDLAQAREKAAALVGVSPRTVQRVWTVEVTNV